MSESPVSTGTVSTWEVLLSLGFREDPSAPMRGFSLDLGTFRIVGVAMHESLVRRDRPADRGIYDGRTLIDFHEELPAKVESREAALAFLASALDRNAPGQQFVPAVAVPWLEEARRHKHLVPWERVLIEARERQARYAAAPRCRVDRDWMRVAIRTLKTQLANVEPNTAITVSFDGMALSFSCNGVFCVMPATGNAWTTPVRVSAGSLAALPRRLSRDVEVCVWESTLVVG